MTEKSAKPLWDSSDHFVRVRSTSVDLDPCKLSMTEKSAKPLLG